MPATKVVPSQIDLASVTVAGDLSGGLLNPSVVKIRGRDIDPTAPIAGQALVYDGTKFAPSTPGGINTPGVQFGDGISTSSISVGTTGYVRLPYGGTITRWFLVSDAAIDCVIDVWKASGTLPTVANSITPSGKPTLTASNISDGLPTAWTSTSLSEGDVLGFRLVSLLGRPKLIVLNLKTVT